jgi:uncharacterized RDD family membrane protein YckC
VIFYDALLLLAVLIIASALVVLPTGLVFDHTIPSGNGLFRAYLVGVSMLFYCGFWVHGGQTLGMRTWRVEVVRDNGEPLRWRDALLRWLCALLSWLALGAGFLWILVDREKKAWHDRLSGTRLIMSTRD